MATPPRGPARRLRAALDEGRLRPRGHRAGPARCSWTAARSSRAPATRRASPGRDVVTLEGLPDATPRTCWADAFVSTGASQCGFCSPGHRHEGRGAARARSGPDARGDRPVARRQPLPLHRLREDRRRASRPSPRSGAASAGRRRPRPAAGVGARADRIGARDMALGEQPFVADMIVPGMLHGALRLSRPPAGRRPPDRHVRAPHARPGVVAVVTAADVPGERRQGLIARDWPVFVAEGETTRYVGDVLAAVAARRARRPARPPPSSRSSTRSSSRSPTRSPPSAPDAPAVHDARQPARLDRSGAATPTAALAAPPTSSASASRRSAIEHAFLEPEACLAVPGPPRPASPPAPPLLAGPGRLGRPAPGRVAPRPPGDGRPGHPGRDRRRVRRQGGPHASRARPRSWPASPGRPVLLALSRGESLRAPPEAPRDHPGLRGRLRRRGRLVAVRARIVGDTGAYASVGRKVLERAAGHACGAYRVPNVDVEARTVYTNNPPAGAFRGFGVPQVDVRDGRLPRPARRAGRPRRLGDPLAERLPDRRPVRVPASAWARASASRRRSSPSATPTAARPRCAAGSPAARRTWGSATGWCERGPGDPPASSRTARSRSGTPGPRWARASTPSSPRSSPRRSASTSATVRVLRRHRARARHRRDDGLAGDDARRPGGRSTAARRLRALDAPAARRRPRDARRAGVRRRVRRRLDDDDRRRHRGPGHPPRLRLGDAGRHPRRRGPAGRVVAAQDVGRAMNPTLLEGQVEGGVHMGLGLALTEAFVHRGRRARSRRRSSRWGSSPPRGCRRSRSSSSRSPSRRARTGRRVPARRSSCRRRPRWPARSTPSTAAGGRRCRCATRRRRGRRPAAGRPLPRAGDAAGELDAPRPRRRGTDVGDHPGPRLRPPPPLLGARAGDAGAAEGRRPASRRSSSRSGGASTPPSTSR